MSRRGGSGAKRKRWEENPITLTIDNLSHEGRGVGKLDGKTVFVDGALPGEEVEAIFTRRRTRFDDARLQQVITASEQRVEPPCVHAAICGGCSFQHLDTEQVIQFKEHVLREQLHHFAGQAPEEGYLPSLSDETLGYRRRARLGVKYVEKKGGVLVGFREKLSHFIADIDRCLVLDPRVGQLIQPLKMCIGAMDIRDKIPQIEVAMGDQSDQGEHDEVALIFRHLAPVSDDDMDRLKVFADQYQVAIYLQEKGPSTVKKVYPLSTASHTEQYRDAGQKSESSEGSEKSENTEVSITSDHKTYERLSYALHNQAVRFQFHPTDFTQVNAGINQKMVTEALRLLALEATDRVLDLFCGLGNFTLPMAKVCQHVTGVEGSDLMVERGFENADFNDITNVSFYSNDLFATPERWNSLWAGVHYDKILLDPPRSGAQEVVQEIERFQAQKVLYVSCNPATLARDAGILTQKGYRLVTAGVMDMFPHTTHVESIALFEK